MSRKRSATGWAIALAIGFAAAPPGTPARAAAALRYAGALTPLLDAAAGKPVGDLDPGAAVDVLGQSGSATQVAVHGWSAQGADATVLAAPDRRVAVLSGFSGTAAPGGAQTVGGVVYRAVTVTGWVATSALADDVETVWKSAGALNAQSCASCHALVAPSAYPADQWPAILKTQAVNAGLDAGQTALLTAYLQSHSGR